MANANRVDDSHLIWTYWNLPWRYDLIYDKQPTIIPKLVSSRVLGECCDQQSQMLSTSLRGPEDPVQPCPWKWSDLPRPWWEQSGKNDLSYVPTDVWEVGSHNRGSRPYGLIQCAPATSMTLTSLRLVDSWQVWRCLKLTSLTVVYVTDF